jgi:putative transposase
MGFVDDYKNVRLKNYDYHNGWFFVTNKTDFSKPYLCGDIHDLVKTELENVSKISTGATLDYGTIVPTHVHCVLIFNDSALKLSEVWRRFKARCTINSKKLGFKGRNLWQRNFYEHIIRNERALHRIRNYIKENPLKERLPLNEIYGDEMGYKASL